MIDKRNNKSFEEKILTSLRNGKVEYVTKNVADKVKALAEGNERVVVIQEDFLYKLQLRRD